MNAPAHFLEDQLAAKLLPHCTAATRAEEQKQATGVARMLLEVLERRYWQGLDRR